MRFIATLNEVPNKRRPISLKMFCFLYLTLKESDPVYLSEKKPFKCVVKPKENLINRFLWTYFDKTDDFNCEVPKTFQKLGKKKKKKKKHKIKKENQNIEKNAQFLPEFLKVFYAQSQHVVCFQNYL